MRPEPKRFFQRVEPRWITLPPDIAFLRDYGIPLRLLQDTHRLSLRLRLPAADTLVAQGTVSTTLYYHALAHHLGLPFLRGPAAVALPIDMVKAARAGLVRLDPVAGGGWLLAPRGRAIDRLLAAKDQNGAVGLDVAITTPAHLSALMQRAGRLQITHDAAFALIDRDPDLSAKTAIDAGRRWTSLGAVAALAGLIALAPRAASIGAGFLFFAAIASRLLLCAQARPESADPLSLSDAELPLYSVIVPLYDEAAMIPDLIDALDRLDYPAAKLEIKIVLETDDRATRQALEAHSRSSHYDIVVAPPGLPRTKPRALNVALPLLRGALVAIYDAEDAPEPGQLREAAARFRHAPISLACLQARIAVNNAAQGWLPRLFAIEYATLFDVYNVGIASLGLPMALGGTSNHFRTQVLRDVGGWDAWNVAEDADLGFRLARFGFRTDMLASTTFEQAPSDFGSWFKQRRRWTKGWVQTILVLARTPLRLRRDLGAVQTAVIILMAITLVVGPLLSPVALIILAYDIASHGLPDPRAWAGLAATSLWVSVFVIGGLASLWCGYVGIRARGLKGCLAMLPLMLPYQIMISGAAWMGLVDLIRNPYHWHKTTHRAERRDPGAAPPIRPGPGGRASPAQIREQP